MELKKVHKQDRVRKPQEPYPTSERCRPPLWPPTQCTCIPSSLCYSHTTKRTRNASALRWRPERGPASFRSGVGFLRLSNPVLFVYFFQLHPYSKWSFFRNSFPLVIILVFHVCVCLSVCVFVISEFSGKGPPSDTPLSPTWRASSGELQRLHLESTGRVLRERKPLEDFHWWRVKPRPSRYNGAILKKRVVFLKKFRAFSPSTGTQQGRRTSSLRGKLC